IGAGLGKMCFKHRLFSIALPMLRRCPSREMSPKESRMESKFMNRGGADLLVDKRLKNKWRWAWIEEIGKDSKPFGSWCMKLREGGACFCTLCSRQLLYATSGEKVLPRHERPRS